MREVNKKLGKFVDLVTENPKLLAECRKPLFSHQPAPSMLEMSTPDRAWGSISGPLLARKHAPELPLLPSSARRLPTAKVPVIEVDKDIAAGDLLSVVRYANKVFDGFVLTGPEDFQARVALLGPLHVVKRSNV